MFKSVMNEMTELKQTVASLLEPMDDGEYEDNAAESNKLEAATPVGRKEPNAGETSKTPVATASGSKPAHRNSTGPRHRGKNGNDVDEGLVKLLSGLLKDKLQEDKVQTRIDKFPPQARTSDLKSQKSRNTLIASTVAC